MRKSFFVIAAVILVFAALLYAGDNEYRYSLWLGGHYDSYDDYGKKVGEFRNLYDNAYPEAKFVLFARGQDYFLNLGGHYYDNKNITGNISGKWRNRITAHVEYQLFRRQLQTDLLNNINAREMLATGAGGGKMLTHEDLDPGFDYNYDRHKIESDFSILVSEKNDIKFTAAHRFWTDRGDEQKVGSMHCFSCHLSSQAVEVKRTVNQFSLGFEGKPGPIGVSYNFMYSKFQSDADAPVVYFDGARHPVTGGSAAEFDSRVIYSGEDVTYGTYPETEKIGNKLKFTADIGKHRLSWSGFYYRSRNNLSDLESSILRDGEDNLTSQTYGGTANFAAVLNKTMRMTARASLSRTEADDIYVELPLWRYNYDADTAYTGGGQDFSFTRYSSLDRLEGKGSLEFNMRASPKTTVSLLAGYEGTRRDDYPEYGLDNATNRFIGQAKIRYREGLKYSLSFKYRLESTDNPFTNYNGLFEEMGRGTLTPLEGNSFVFYFQREDLKYQNVTTLPTIEHLFELSGNLRLNNKASLNADIKARLDKNNNLDSLDVKRTYFQPSLGFNITPDPRWYFAGGMRYQYLKSRGPLAVAMFDG